MINTRTAYRYEDYICINHNDGSSVWADLSRNGNWFVWISNSHEKLPVGVYDYDNAIDVMMAISDTLL